MCELFCGGGLGDLIHVCVTSEDEGDSMGNEGAYTRADDCFSSSRKMRNSVLPQRSAPSSLRVHGAVLMSRHRWIKTKWREGAFGTRHKHEDKSEILKLIISN